MARESIVLDPGPDFAKTPAQTVTVLQRLDALTALGRPVLLAVSRKDFIGALTQRTPRQRDAGPLAAIGAGVDAGASILRVHDVAAVHDPRRDAPARYDLTTVRVKNTDARFALTAHVRDLRGGRKQILVFGILPIRGQDTWSFQTVRRTNGT